MAYIQKGNKCELDGFKFDSEPERNYYIKLKDLKSNKLIKDFKMQIPYNLQSEFTDFQNRKVQSINYIGDYVVELNNGEIIVLDTKGSKATTEESARLKQKLFMFQNRDMPIYFIAPLPKYLGGEWVDVTKGCDFGTKLKTRYVKTFGKWKRNVTPNWCPNDWEIHFEFENFNELFYLWKNTKKLKR